MSYIRSGRYHHDTDQYEREVLTASEALAFVGKVGQAAHGVFEAIVPRDDNEWANSVTVHTSVEDRKGRRAVTVLRSSDPNSTAKELGHVTFLGRQLKSGRKSRKQGRRVFVEGAHSMTKAMAGVTGGQLKLRRRRGRR